MRPKSMILILIALGCGLIASIGISQVIERGSDEPAEQIKTSPIFVALADIDIGEELTAQRVKLEEWPIDRIPPGAVISAEQFEGQAPRQRLFAGEPILLGKLASTDSLTSASHRVKPGHRVMSVKVTMDTAVSHLIPPGDHVDILAFLRGGRGFNPKAEMVLANVEVFAVDSKIFRDVEEDGTTIQAKTVSLQVTPKQANKLVFFAELARLHLTLRSPEDDNEKEVDETVEPTLVPPSIAPVVNVPQFRREFKMQVLDGTGRTRVFAFESEDSDELPREVTSAGDGPSEKANDVPLPPFKTGLPGDDEQEEASNTGEASNDEASKDGAASGSKSGEQPQSGAVEQRKGFGYDIDF